MAGTKSNTRQWFIYALHRDGVDFYVGRTFTPDRRAAQHRLRFGQSTEIRILENGVGHRNAIEAECSWMDRITVSGAILVNKIKGSCGSWEVDPETREKIRNASFAKWKNPEYAAKVRANVRIAVNDPVIKERRRIAIQAAWDDPVEGKRLRGLVSKEKKGRKQDPKSVEKRAVKMRGKPQQWSPEGRAIVAKSQFKPGVNTFALMSEEAKERKREAARKSWEGIQPEERTRRATERNAKMWADRSTAARKAIGEKIWRTRKRNASPEQIRDKAIEFGSLSMQTPGMREKIASTVKSFWANMTPEYREEYLTRRTAAIVKAKAAKRDKR